MYALWKELSSLENTVGIAHEIVGCLKDRYFTRAQQIQCTLARRTPLGRRSFQELNHDSMSFRFLPESDSSFDSSCEYIGFVIHSYEGKIEFTLNDQHYQRGDILIKNIGNLQNNMSILKLHTRNQKVYHNLYKSLLDEQFKTTSYEGLVGLRITYERAEWNFSGPVIGSDVDRSPLFTPEEHQLLEMFILSWTENLHNQGAIRDVAHKMLYKQFAYIKNLMETGRSDMKEIWTARELDMAIRICEWEIQNAIDTLFHKPSVFNTFSDIREQIETNNQRLSLTAKHFERCQLAVNEYPSQASLWQIWKQLEAIEIALYEKEFHSIDLRCPTAVEYLFGIAPPLFLDQLGICPESDSFDPKQDYLGILIYLDESIKNEHQCQSGQLFLRQKENIPKCKSGVSYRKTSFAPLLIHEQLYQLHFKKKPDQHFHGIGFIYEQGQWKFDLIIYAGKSGIHSAYDDHINISKTADISEQYCLDLVLFTLYINNRWKNDLGCMYTIDELEAIARELFRKEVEALEKLFQSRRKSLEEATQRGLEKLIEQYKPNASSDSITSKVLKILESTDSSNTHQVSNEPSSKVTLLNSHASHRRDTFITHVSHEASSLETQTMDSNQQDKSRKIHSTRRTIAFPSWKQRSDSRAKSLDLSGSTHALHQPQSERISIPTESKSRRNSDAIVSNTEEPPTLYQLWIELRNARHKIFGHANLIQFSNYLQEKAYLNGSGSIIGPPDDSVDEYHLMARIQIDSELEFICQLFVMKKSKLSTEQSSEARKNLEQSFAAFKRHYEKQISRAKKHSKSK